MKPTHGISRRYDALTSAEVVDAVHGATLVWPIGSIEQHGPHLPLSVDVLLACAVAEALAARLNGLALPALSVGTRSLPQSGGGLHFPGTLFLEGSTFLAAVTDTLRSLDQLPYARLIVVNGHFENEALLFEALDSSRVSGHMPGREVFAFSWWSLVSEEWLATNLPNFPGWHAEHAGLTETALMLHLHPELVHPQRPVHESPPRSGIYLHPIDPESFTTQGVLSSTTGASAELGQKLFCHIVDQAVALIAEGLTRESRSTHTTNGAHP